MFKKCYHSLRVMKFSKFFEFKKGLRRGNRFQRILVLIVVLVALPFTLYEVFQGAKYLSNALVNPVALSFLPSSVAMPPDATLRLMLDAKSNKIAFTRIELSFDKTKVNLSSEITPNPIFKKVISMTSKVDANSTGKIVMILGLDPADINSAPTSVFELANFSITSLVPSAVGGTGAFSITSSNVQIVDLTPASLTVASTDAVINFATPSPSPSPSPTATPTIAPTATPTATPTPTASASPTPTASPIPTCTPPSCSNPASGCVYQGTNSCSCGVLVCASPSPTSTAIPGGTSTPTATPQAIPGDINGDGKVNLLDYIVLFENFGKTSNFDTRADINKDGKVNLLDYIVLFENFGKTAQ